MICFTEPPTLSKLDPAAILAQIWSQFDSDDKQRLLEHHHCEEYSLAWCDDILRHSLIIQIHGKVTAT